MLGTTCSAAVRPFSVRAAPRRRYSASFGTRFGEAWLGAGSCTIGASPERNMSNRSGFHRSASRTARLHIIWRSRKTLRSRSAPRRNLLITASISRTSSRSGPGSFRSQVFSSRSGRPRSPTSTTTLHAATIPWTRPDCSSASMIPNCRGSVTPATRSSVAKILSRL